MSKKHKKGYRKNSGGVMGAAKALGAALIGTTVTIFAAVGLEYTSLSPMVKHLLLAAVGLVGGGAVIAFTKSPFAHDAGVAILSVPVGSAIFMEVVRAGINSKLNQMAAQTAAAVAAAQLPGGMPFGALPAGNPIGYDAIAMWQGAGNPIGDDALNQTRGAFNGTGRVY